MTSDDSGGRLPRYRRAKKPPNMRLQPRDMDILRAIGCEYRYMTKRQIHILLFGGSISKTQRRLTGLYHNRYLDRAYRPTAKGSGEAVYYLDRRGADVLVADLGMDRTQLFWQGRRKALSHNSLEHALRVSDFRVAMTVACRENDTAHIPGEWVGEQLLRDLKQKVRILHPSDPDRYTERGIVADGFFSMEFANGHREAFMLEIDMGTESNARFALKVKAYKEYLAGGNFRELFDMEEFKVLVVTTGALRAENLMRTARKAGDKTMVWFTDFSRYMQDSQLLPDRLLSPIWRVAGDWYALEEGWRGGRYAQSVTLRDAGRARSLLELADTAGVMRDA